MSSSKNTLGFEFFVFTCGKDHPSFFTPPGVTIKTCPCGAPIKKVGWEKKEMAEREMTDREMLLVAYGALKADSQNNPVTRMVELHLFPPDVKKMELEQRNVIVEAGLAVTPEQLETVRKSTLPISY